MSNRIIGLKEDVGYVEQVPKHTDHLPMRLITFHMTHLKSWGVDRLLTPLWRLYCNLENGAEIIVGKQVFPMKARHVYMVPPWVIWSGRCTPGIRHIVAHFDLPGMTRSLVRAAFPLPMQVYPKDTRSDPAPIDLTRQFEALAETVSQSGRGDPFIACWSKSVVYWGLREAFSMTPPEIRRRCLQPGSGHQPLMRVLHHIDTHLHEPLDNDTLAEIIPCSRPHLVRLFRAQLNVSPARYVAERRVSRAAELLAYSDHSLEAIAANCGYANRHHFTRVFSKGLGTPPARYRKVTLR